MRVPSNVGGDARRDAENTPDDGRELAFAEIGDPGDASVFFHGASMSRLHLAGLEERLADRGIRVVAPDRPGYGRSSPHPGRSMADWPRALMSLPAYLADIGITYLICPAVVAGMGWLSESKPEQAESRSRSRELEAG